MPKVQDTSKVEQQEQPKPAPQEQYYGYQRRGIMEILFNLETALFFIMIFLLILWIGIIFGLAGGSLYYQVGRILYSLGGIFLFFFLLGTSIMNNNINISLRISLVALTIVILILTMAFP
ncbi:MAG: hypothetical protein ACP5G5_00330 [Thermoplasmata archaeon]|jgi:hypothetical protein